MGFYIPPKSIPPAGQGTILTGLAGVRPSLLASALVPPPPPSLLTGLGTFPAISTTAPWSWQYVRRRFSQFLSNVTITEPQRQDGERKQAGVRACLNKQFWGHNSETANSFLIGSWGKGTRLRPPRDIDILFLLPPEIYWRYQTRSGNRQSQLLQEVKSTLAETYSQTTMRADGQVIVVPFNTTPVEISPGFLCDNGSIITCDTNNNGSYKTSSSKAEAIALDSSDVGWNGNTRALVRMIKQWQRVRNVPLKSFQIERVAIEFLSVWAYSHQDVFYYDWMIRDFFAYLIQRTNGHIVMPGTGEMIALGSDWLSRAVTAHRHAAEACNNERDNYEALAGTEWQEIFGSAIPVLVT